jgi:hypothetical protein
MFRVKNLESSLLWKPQISHLEHLWGGYSSQDPSTRNHSPWRWRQQDPPKSWYPTTTIHGVATQQTLTPVSTAVRTSALNSLSSCSHIFSRLHRRRYNHSFHAKTQSQGRCTLQGSSVAGLTAPWSRAEHQSCPMHSARPVVRTWLCICACNLKNTEEMERINWK